MRYLRHWRGGLHRVAPIRRAQRARRRGRHPRRPQHRQARQHRAPVAVGTGGVRPGLGARRGARARAAGGDRRLRAPRFGRRREARRRTARGHLLRNVRGSDVVLSAAAALERPVMFASTSEVYGKNDGAGLTEASNRVYGATGKSRWNYATSKSFGEALALGYHQELGAQNTVVRFFNTVGPRQTGAYGMVLPSFVRQALTGERPHGLRRRQPDALLRPRLRHGRRRGAAARRRRRRGRRLQHRPRRRRSRFSTSPAS